ncbi:hypothetical protein [Actinomadura parmotrematis]|uniref:Uncharacterized protein n=1 Tax=Actinomadura parmotrematis TaxID=2864039 RepID=A0ABS7FNJ8_9ACTN|nr:hypothetical protein [Actinomadura parmotrematis]MBW8481167.1 hypothetical protein [Actinomadura parmotrematis]
MSSTETARADAPPREPDGAGGGPLPPFLRANAVTLAAGAVAALLGGVVWFALPHEHDITSLWIFLFKLTPFAAGAVAVAWLHVGWARRLRLPLVAVPACFLVFFCFFVPRIFFVARKPTEELYYTVLTLVPFVILALALAYRLGGGPRGTTLRLSAAMLLLQLSGLEDLAFLTVNPQTDPKWTPIPDTWTWADHIKVFLGHYPSKEEAYAFIAVHVLLALAVLFVPASAVRAGWAKVRRGR